MGGLGNPAVRIVLVGSKTPAPMPNFTADLDPIIFSEIVEFALSLSPAGKGQEAFAGLPHLQAFKFFRAVSLAEVGEVQLANRYDHCLNVYYMVDKPTGIVKPSQLRLDGLRPILHRRY